MDHAPPPDTHYQTNALSLAYLTTEKTNALTKNLSQVMHEDCMRGLELLHQADFAILDGFTVFAQNHLPMLHKLVKQKFAEGGRCFLVGSGSSGRVSIDLAAKSTKRKVIGVIAGGDSAFIRAREGFEDSEKDGRAALKSCHLTPHDIVFLISASGSASFNIGAAQEAKEAGATVCYFYNSSQVPANTQSLFDAHGVIPVLVDIGPQAITGSTRLQAASLAELCLGCLLSEESPDELIQALKDGNQKIKDHFKEISQIIQLEYETFSDPQANFRRLKDETAQGYVTFVAGKDALREVMIDTTETSPTFSTNPPRTLAEAGKKKAEFQACMAKEKDNLKAWQSLIGRKVNPEHLQDVEQFVISEHAFNMRSTGKGNLVIGVAKEKHKHLLPSLDQARKNGARTAMVCISDKAIAQNIKTGCDAAVFLEGIKKDRFGIVPTILLKQMLNMISNGSMVLMNKVDGNQMIDVNASNKKLIDRAVRLIQDIFSRYRPDATVHYDTLQQMVLHIREKKKEYEQKNIYTPSPVKIGVTMIQKGLDFDNAVEFLHAHREELQKVFL
ncbi:MAG TPA: SIS domain-containing protein [Rhabdochlamydiaceae bacterium]|nr:SIS domain-containing protein [Rhabdochlamydiaceae bacterium]